MSLFSKIFNRNTSPIIKENTFLIWEPCSRSHAEVVPGYTKYLLDLGYHVSILMTPTRFKEGLFDKFESKNLSFNKMPQKQIRAFFKNNSLKNVRGVLVTTVGKLCDNDIQDAYKSFHPSVDKSKIFFVEHEIDKLADNSLKESIITLREMNYRNAKTSVINPHYFGKIKAHQKNDLTNFITIGALSEKRKSTKLLIEAVKSLLEQNVTNFKITVIGKGKISNFPKELRKFFSIKGRLDFKDMYNEIEKADFILSAYEDTPEHQKYITIKTSGTFQLVYGFLKPIIIRKDFAEINRFNNDNAILYNDNNYSDAMKVAIEINKKDYSKLQMNLKNTVENIYSSSKDNFEHLIKSKGNF